MCTSNSASSYLGVGGTASKQLIFREGVGLQAADIQEGGGAASS